jgi:DNA-binding MarR family transcriptional regulator
MCNNYYDVQSSIGFLTVTANRLMSVYFRKRLIESGIDLTAEQWGVLAQLWNQDSVSQDELAHLLCVDKSSLSRVLDVMERKGLVARRRDPGDARRKILCSTPAAERLKTQCRDVAESAIADMLKGISPSDHAACVNVLGRIKDNIRGLSE